MRGATRSENPLLASCSLCYVSWEKKPWEVRGVLELGVGEEPPCTSHCRNKATLLYSPFQIMCLIVFVSRFLFLLLTAGLSFCQCVKDSM